MFEFWRVKSAWQRVWWVVGAMVMAGVFWKLTPSATSHAHRADGYAYLTEALEILGDQNPEPDFCVEGGIADSQALGLVKQAIAELEEAREARPMDSQTLLLLGRGYCLSGRFEEAVEAYKAYTELRPENPLGHLELGFAYARMYRTILNDNHDDLYMSIRAEFQHAGIQATSLTDEGKRAFFAHQFVRANDFFELSTIIASPLPQQALFLWNMASVAKSQKLPVLNDTLAPPIHVITDTTKIEAETLYWVHEGKALGIPLGEFPTGDLTVGVMWWNGSAIAFVNVVRSGLYHITLRALDAPPAPIKLEIEHNFTKIAEFSLLQGKHTWEELETSIYMESGLHIVGVHYSNDEVVNQLNRNAIIDWLEFKRN